MCKFCFFLSPFPWPHRQRRHRRCGVQLTRTWRHASRCASVPSLRVARVPGAERTACLVLSLCFFFFFSLLLFLFSSFSQLPAWRRWWFVISDRRCVIYDALVLSGRRDASAFLSLILGMRLLCFSVLFRLYKPSVVYWSSRLRIVFPLDIFVAGGARAKLRHLTTAEIAALYASAVAGSVTTRFRPPVAPV